MDHSIRKGTVYVLLSTLLFSINTLMIKQLSAGTDSLSLSVIRFAVGSLFGFGLLKILKVPFKIQARGLWTLRGVLGSFTMILYFWSIQLNGIAWSTVLVNTSSFFVALNGALFFKQKFSKKTLLGILIAFTGVVVIFFTSREISLFPSLLALSVAYLRGFTAHIIKKSSQKNHPVLVYMAATLFGLIYAPVAWPQLSMLAADTLFWASMAGIVVFMAQVVFTAGIKRISPDRSSVLMYLSIPLSLFFGFITGEEITIRFMIGTALILGGILLEILWKPNRKPFETSGKSSPV